MADLIQDLRYALRSFAARPAFAAAAVVSLALGIGVTTTAVGLLDAVLLRHPPVAEVEKLAWVMRHDLDDTFSYLEAADYRERSGAFSALAVYQSATLDLRRGDLVDRVSAEIVGGGYFRTLGVGASRGRVLTAADERGTEGPVIVLSHGLARRLFGEADPVGRKLILNRHPFTVVGVAAEGFSGLSFDAAVDLWVPISSVAAAASFLEPDVLSDRGSRWLRLVGRLRSGIDLAEGQRRLHAVTEWMGREFPETNLTTDRRILVPVAGGHPLVRERTLPRLAMLSAAAALLLLIAGANVASLLLARAVTRTRELGIRQALGAGRRRLLRQLFTESLLLFLAGGVAGVALSAWGAALMPAVLPPEVVLAPDRLQPDLRAVAVAFAATLATALVFGLAPALRGAASAAVPGLRQAPGATTGGAQRVKSWLVAGQVALSFVLLVGTGLLVRTVAASLAVDPGFDARGVLAVNLSLSRQGYGREDGSALYARLAEELAALPGVESVHLVAPAPLAGWWMRATVTPEGYQGREDEDMNVQLTAVSPGHFRTLRIPLLAGRDLGPGDRPGAPEVAVVNRAFVRRFWPEGPAVGRRIETPRGPVEVVGVAADVRHLSLHEEPAPRIYLPLAQRYEPGVTALVRTRGEPLAALPAVRRTVAGLDPYLPLYAVGTLDGRLRETVSEQHAVALVLSGLGAIALALSAIGLYGLLAFDVRRRWREIGVRVAVGADGERILRGVLGRGLALTAAGAAAGLVASLPLAALLRSQLFGVETLDPLTYAAAALVLALAAGVSSLIPALRAVRIDPVEALRFE